MRILARLVLSAAVPIAACRGPPIPEDVAGIYELYSRNGEVQDWGEGPAFLGIELDQDGTSRQWRINVGEETLNYYGEGPKHPGDTLASQHGGFSVSEGEDGCIEITYWVDSYNRREIPGTICGDLWTIMLDDGDTEVLKRRR
jgi:hypothetical protein